jgi:sugar phosphate permease
VFTAALGLIGPVFWLVAVLLFCTGFFAGFYIIPLQALLQHLSPNDERGRFLGTANAISFVACSVAGLFVLICREALGMPANRVFLVCSGLLAIGSSIMLWFMRRIIAHPEIADHAPTLCPTCGDDLHGGDRCPECGWTRAE